MRIDINLASRPFEDQRKFWLRWGIPMFLLAIVTLVLLYSMVVGLIIARKDRVVMRDTETRIADRDNERQRAEALLNLPQNRTTRDKSQYLNSLFVQKSFSWTRVFEDLEKVMPANLHVVSIRPEMNPETGLQLTLIVAGESRDRAEELVRHMEASQHFSQTHIKEETAETGRNTGDNVKFDIVATYIPEVPTEASAETAPKKPAKAASAPGGAL